VPRAFITGITGQDGQHLAEFLHGQGYDVYGMVKGQNNPRVAAVLEEMPFIETVPGDLADLPSLVAALEVQPDEVYNLGAISFVALSFNQAELTANITGLGVLRMLEAIRMVGGTQGQPDPLLPGVVVGDVRQGARDPQTRGRRSTRGARTGARRCSVTTSW
jgi:GDPmannose 4,6-dehydratase